MVHEMLKAGFDKIVAEDYPHLEHPAVLLAQVTSAAEAAEKEIEAKITDKATGETRDCIIKIKTYRYGVQIIRSDAAEEDEDFPRIPPLTSSQQLEVGTRVAVALLGGELSFAIVGEVL